MGNRRPAGTHGAGPHAETFGGREDPAILLLADPAGWRPQERCSRLAAGLRFVIRHTAEPAGAAALLTALDAGPAHIVATSVSEHAVRRLAATHPDLVASITLISPGPASRQAYPPIPVLVLDGTGPDMVIPAILRYTCGSAAEPRPEPDIAKYDQLLTSARKPRGSPDHEPNPRTLSPRRPTLTSVEDILALTRKALDEFESMPLAASLRRAADRAAAKRHPLRPH